MTSAVVDSVKDALFRGAAVPPWPRSSRLRRPMPRRLRWLPVETLDLVRLGDVLLAWLVFGTTMTTVTLSRAAIDHLGWTAPLWGMGGLLTAAAFAVPVALRDRWPLLAWRIAVAAAPGATLIYHEFLRLNQLSSEYPQDLTYVERWLPSQLALGYLLVLYSVAVRCERRITAVAWLLSIVVVWLLVPGTTPSASIVMTLIVLFGYNVQVRRSATDRLARERKRTVVAEAAQAVLEERARIARELHDVVAHHMSVIAIQAEAVPLEARGDPARLERGLAEVRGLSLAAIRELRQVLGVLRDDEGGRDTAPQPGLDRLDELIAHAGAAGLVVEFVRPDSPEQVRSSGGVAPAAELSGYRIVQEALSNAMRHAPGSSVRVEVSRSATEVRLRVENGPGRVRVASPGAGHGLLGMRERVSLLGGSFSACPTPGGGFEVIAMLPVPPGEP